MCIILYRQQSKKGIAKCDYLWTISLHMKPPYFLIVL